jgi:hypothetical protein
VALLAGRGTSIAGWKRSTKSVLAVVDQVAGGSPKAIKDWGFDVTARVAMVPTTDPPQGLRATYDKALELTVRWKGVRGNRGYNLQIGDGSQTGWGALIQLTQAHYKPTGLTPGQHVLIRVAVQRTTGVSGWSDSLAVVVR